MTLLLGIDIGTSSAKVVLFDPATARVIAVAAREYPIHKPAPDRAEQNAEDWWTASVDAVNEALEKAGRRDVAGIGFSGQMHGGVLLDEAGAIVRPAIIWADLRTTAEVEAGLERVGARQHAAIAGTLPAAGFFAPTLLWLARHEPESLQRAATLLMPKDYVRFRLTGLFGTDITDAAATALFDVTRREWSPLLVEAYEAPPSLLPPVSASAEVAGPLLPEAARILGLEPDIPVVFGCADQPAQAIGNGVIAPGLASVTTGSGGQVFTPLRFTSDRAPSDPRLHVFNHAAPHTWYVLGAILSAGLSLRWLRGITGLDGVASAYAQFSSEAGALEPGADGLIFLPYLAGERTPHMDPAARGAFIGLSYHHTRGHLARAVMEGVAFALRQALELSLALGGEVSTIIAAGGGAESDVWRQIQADVFGLPLQQTLLPEQAGVGAALLAGVGAGVYPTIEAACERVVRYGPVTEPDAERHARYNALYEQFVELYPRLREDFHRLARTGVQSS